MPSATVAAKLKVRPDQRILPIDPPEAYIKSLGELPAGARIVKTKKEIDQIHWFVRDRSAMEKRLPDVLSLVKQDVICWIFYPKGSSKMQTDLSRDKGWDELMKHPLQWVSLISFDETWSAFGMRELKKQEKEKYNEKEKVARPRVVFDYVDPVTRAVRLPEDFAAALKPNAKETSFFESLSFSNKKEYIEWIVTARRPETRARRVADSIVKLGARWKNPSNN